MEDMILFWRDLLGVIAEFLLCDPIRYFTGIIFLLLIVSVVNRIIR